MEVSDFILNTLNQMQRSINRAVDGLTQEELAFQPSKECNSIGFTLWHQVRAEDSFMQGMIQQKPQLWIAEKWHQKFNMPEDSSDSGGGYTPEQVAAFRIPALKGLLDYAEAVRAQTVEYVKGMTPEKLDEKIQGRGGEIAIGQVLSMLICEINQHTGQIAYLRGLQRGFNK